MTINATGTPTPLSLAINNPATFPLITTNYADTCVVKDLKITMHVTTATGFGTQPPPNDFTNPNANLGVCGTGVGFSGCSSSILYRFNFNASGNQIGTTCGDFAFDTTSATPFNPLAPPAPPYSGTYQLDPPPRTGVGRQWRLKNMQYDFINTFGHPPDTILQCAQIVITTQTVP